MQVRTRLRAWSVSIAVAACAAALAATAAAEDIAALEHTTPEQRAAFQTEAMKSALSLTPEQLDKV